MKKQTESIVLENKTGQRLRIYKVDGSDTFCIGIEGESDHFEFQSRDADEIKAAIGVIVDSFC
jgi:hypothetical protein